MFGGLFSASNMYQRSIVEAHDGHWLVCLVLDKGSDEPAEADRFALAVPCDDQGRVKLPASPQLIQFTPPGVIEKREKRARCESAGHLLCERWSMSGGKMVRHCECRDKREERTPAPEERGQSR